MGKRAVVGVRNLGYDFFSGFVKLVKRYSAKSVQDHFRSC